MSINISSHLKRKEKDQDIQINTAMNKHLHVVLTRSRKRVGKNGARPRREQEKVMKKEKPLKIDENTMPSLNDHVLFLHIA